jgi:hypothetical protein
MRDFLEKRLANMARLKWRKTGVFPGHFGLDVIFYQRV